MSIMEEKKQHAKGEDLHNPDYYDENSDLDGDSDSGIAMRSLREEAGFLKPDGGDIEGQRSAQDEKKKPSSLMVWILINIFATIGIVFINKSIFDDPSFRGAQLSFASFHFFVTFFTLHMVSSPRFSFFERRKATITQVLPLGMAMCLNVVLPNFSLAFSSVTFYQTARVLLTPITAGLNFFLYGKTIPRQAAYTLIPVCVGVAMVTYYDVKPGANVKNTSFLGVFFAMTGVVASSVYTVWIAVFHKRLDMTSHQLLHNQSLVGAVMLLYFIPFVDTFPVLREVAMGRWIMILMSGACAAAINLSQFIIIGNAGPVASTIVVHSKTLSIVTLGWIVSGRSVSDKSIIGVVVAIGGIMLYSVASTVYKQRS